MIKDKIFGISLQKIVLVCVKFLMAVMAVRAHSFLCSGFFSQPLKYPHGSFGLNRKAIPTKIVLGRSRSSSKSDEIAD